MSLLGINLLYFLKSILIYSFKGGLSLATEFPFFFLEEYLRGRRNNKIDLLAGNSGFGFFLLLFSFSLLILCPPAHSEISTVSFFLKRYLLLCRH